jgi:hypothetical protein
MKGYFFMKRFIMGCLTALGFLNGEAAAKSVDHGNGVHFSKDKKIALIGRAYAQDAVDIAKNNFKIVLDWSDESIKQVEHILDELYKAKAHTQPSEEQIYRFAKIFGSYVGEVFRMNHKADWGMITMGDEQFPGLQSEKKAQLFWPWGKVNNRLMNGEEDNIAHYYNALLELTQ